MRASASRRSWIRTVSIAELVEYCAQLDAYAGPAYGIVAAVAFDVAPAELMADE
jgi:hypothetical protein